MEAVCVGSGAVAGAMLRWQINNLAKRHGGENFAPWSTVVVNVTGSFILGGLFATNTTSNVKLLIGTGFCGSFTTLSTFSLDTLKGCYGKAFGLVFLTNGLSIGACASAYKLFKMKNQMKL